MKRQPRLSLLLLLAPLLLVACGGGGLDDSAVYNETVFIDGKLNPRLEGVWRVGGEGRLLDVGKINTTVYQETATLCWTGKDATRLTAQTLIQLPVRITTVLGANVRIEVMGSEGGQIEFVASKVSALPEACKTPLRADGPTIFRALWEAMDQDYAFFRERGVDWAARRAALAPRAAQAQDAAALEAVLIDALRGLRDVHVDLERETGSGSEQFFNSDDTSTLRMLRTAFENQTEVQDFDAYQAGWRQLVQDQVAPLLTQEQPGRSLNGAMIWGRLPGNVGYIELSRLGGFSPGGNSEGVASDVALIRAELDRALNALSDTRGLILDLSLLYEGGWDRTALEVAGRFVASRRLAFSTSHRPGRGLMRQDSFIEPRGSKPYLQPVMMLTSDRTISAGDVLAMTMRDLPQVTQAGQTTNGAYSSPITKPLPGGYFVGISTELIADAQGQVWEGRGLAPRLPLSLFDPSDPQSLLTGHAEAVQALAQRLR